MIGYRAVVIGCSTGGLQALQVLLSALPRDFGFVVAVVQHLRPDGQSGMAKLLTEQLSIPVKEVDDKERLVPGAVYLAPPNYHFLIERDGMASLSVDEKEHHSRPSIDVLFESAADAYGSQLVGILLTGANADGAAGMRRIHTSGGLTIVQDPRTALAPEMPLAALKLITPDHLLPIPEIAELLAKIKPSGEC